MSTKETGAWEYPKLPNSDAFIAALITSGGDLKSISATHSGMMSDPSYFPHFKLWVLRRSGILSNNSLFKFLHPPSSQETNLLPGIKIFQTNEINFIFRGTGVFEGQTMNFINPPRKPKVKTEVCRPEISP